MIIYHQQVKLVDEVEDILCNSCGRSCKMEINFECAAIDVIWGYESSKDGEFHQAHLCEKCWDDVVKNFKLGTLVKRDCH